MILDRGRKFAKYQFVGTLFTTSAFWVGLKVRPKKHSKSVQCATKKSLWPPLKKQYTPLLKKHKTKGFCLKFSTIQIQFRSRRNKDAIVLLPLSNGMIITINRSMKVICSWKVSEDISRRMVIAIGEAEVENEEVEDKGDLQILHLPIFLIKRCLYLTIDF